MAKERFSPGKVLMTTDAVGGVWTYSVDLARALASLGVDVCLAVMGPSLSDPQRAEALKIPRLELHEIGGKLEWMDEPWLDIARASDRLLQLESLIHPDIIHLNSYVHGALSWSSPVVMVGHSCVLSWYQAVHGCAAPAQWNPYRTAVQKGIRAADALVAPSSAMLKSLEDFYGAPRIKLVIPNSRQSESFRAATKEPIVLGAGRVWDQAKNFGLLDRAAANIPWEVQIAGEPSMAGVEAVPIKNAKLLGSLAGEALAKRLGAASLFVAPALYEPFGLSVLEAALAGCCLVLSDIPSLRENWQGAAYFFDPQSSTSLETLLLTLIGNRAMREEMALRGRKQALAFTPTRMAHAYLDLYESVMERRFQRQLNSYAGTRKQQCVSFSFTTR
jgi:glycogen synthase